MRSTSWRIAGGIVFLLATALIIAVPIIRSPRITASPEGLHVVAAENFWGDIARQIGGSTASVTSIITDPSADPHLYESSARDAVAIASAQVVITNGLGYDDFMNKLLGTSHSSTRQVIVAADILHISGSTTNPHIWYDIPRVHEVADTISQTFAQADPSHAAIYKKNAVVFDDSLKPLLATLATIQQKYGGAPVAYTERVAGYALEASGLTVRSPSGFSRAIEDGNDPSPNDSASMNALITNKSIKVLLYNSQATSIVTSQLKNLATQNGVPVIGVTETMPAHERSYQSWQQDQLNALLGALNG